MTKQDAKVPRTLPTYHEWYQEPVFGTREEIVKAGLKQHRDLARIRLNSREEVETGRAIREHLTFLLDLWTRSDRLPVHQRTAIVLYFFATRRCEAAGSDVSPSRSGSDCLACGQWVRLSRSGTPMPHRVSLSNEDVARQMRLLSPKPHADESERQIQNATKQIARWKRAGINVIAYDPTLWPPSADDVEESGKGNIDSET